LLTVFWGTPAHGQTREEYNQIIAEAEAKLSAAQIALQEAEQAYSEAVQRSQPLQKQIDIARQELLTAQTNYEQNLMPDPTWERPTKEIQVSQEVAKVIQVPHTEMIREVTMVPRTVTTVIPGGLTAKSYNMRGYNNAPPLPTEDKLVKTETVPNIDFQWGGGQILNSGLYEDVIVQFSGTINIPSTGTYGFYAPGDDGIKVIIDNNTIINDWYDKGGGGSTVSTYLTQGSHTITLWFYENGGGANVWLYWAKPGYGYEIVPPSAFGQETITETFYDEVVTFREVTTFTEEIIFETTWHTETVLDLDAIHPSVQNPDLLAIVNEKQNILDNAITSQTENSNIIEVTSQNVLTKQQELDVAQSELEAIPPFKELPPAPETTTEPTPEPTENVVEPLPEPEQTSTPEAPSTAVEQAQEQLEERAAENDTGVLPYTVADAVTEIQAEEVLAVLADPTVLAEAFSEGVGQTIAFVGELFTDPGKTITAVLDNVSQAGLDMTDDQREKAQEVIIPAIIATQIASVVVGRMK
jgi:hypothetical protein